MSCGRLIFDMLLFSVVVIAWTCISLVAALAVCRFVASCDRPLIAEAARHHPSLEDSIVIDEEASGEYDAETGSEPLAPVPL